MSAATARLINPSALCGTRDRFLGCIIHDIDNSIAFCLSAMKKPQKGTYDENLRLWIWCRHDLQQT